MSFARTSFYLSGIIITSFLGTTQIFANTNSGIDLTKSTIQVSYTADDDAGVTNYACLNQSNEIGFPVSLDEALGNFNDGGITKPEKIARVVTDLVIDLNNGDSGSPLEQCFKNAGIYNVKIVLSDVLGNETEEKFKFTIKPSDVDPASITSESSSGSDANCDQVTADGRSVCSVTITLKDPFGNTVYEVSNAIIGFEQPNSNNSNDDANFGLGFVDGLEEGGNSVIGRTNEGTTFTNGIAVFDFIAFAPTVETINGLTTDSANNYGITVVSVPALNNGGTPSGTTTTLNEEIPSDLLFKRPILVPMQIIPGRLDGYATSGETAATDPGQLKSAFTPLADDETPNTLDSEQRIKISLEPVFFPTVSTSFPLVGPIKGAFTRTNAELDYYRVLALNPTENKIEIENVNATTISSGTVTDAHSYLNAAGDHKGLEFTKTSLNTDSNPDNPSNYFRRNGTALGSGHSFDYIFNFSAPNATNNLVPEFNFQSLVEYTVNKNGDNEIVRYYAGHSVDNSDKNKGVFIEGTVIKRDEDTKVLSNDLSVLSGVSQKDIRETITRNATALAREARVIKTSSGVLDLDDFDANTNVIVVKGANVEIGGELPKGKKTLIVIDGNVLISKDMHYNDESADSFGLIALSTTTSAAPEKGNIFVNSSVQNLRGAFYADGGLIGTKSGTTFLGIDNFSEVVLDSALQLRLVGTLLTKNTIGGTGKSGSTVTEYQYPWGTTEDQELAKRYDLLYLRDPFQLNQDRCLQKGEFNEPSQESCPTEDDPNPNSEKGYSFILRFDRKVLEQSPPGFVRSQVINH